MPERARQGVAKELALLDRQITDAYTRLAETRQAQAGDPGFVNNAILGPLKSKRVATLDRIGININRVGGKVPRGLQDLAECQGVPAEQPQTNDGGGQDQNNDGQNNDGQDQNNDGQDQGQDNGLDPVPEGNGGQAGNGPVADDFINIEDVQPGSRNLPNGLAANGDTGSTGSFTTQCGVNENNVFNTDNLIVAPGVDNGAHHTHDYVGNQGNDAFSSDEDLANADTSCQNQADKSTYYWPVLRLQDGTDEFDANQAGGGAEGNVGKILKASQAEIKFVGSRQGDVVAMPKFLRIITGDAKAFTNGLANANTSFSCTGFEDRQVTDKYVICPEGSSVVRTSNFQSCWDGQNIDSANHRTHVAFVQADGTCPNGFQAIPQLQVRLVYDVPAPTVENGQVQNPYAVDGFPEQLHKPITDHNDFINVMDENLMNQVVQCINSGQDCQ
ncbi:putative Secreted protein [Streptomyces viridochromogenes Tue57]|uniref:Putative Secreted protein n=1 Tax=Streptomyces viridochromogenes Tue57 TaxID=1160705 RepID=L8P5A8_STRVR|nr:putative Secreted protein [Streptomyces viridochromogenes Tue57]